MVPDRALTPAATPSTSADAAAASAPATLSRSQKTAAAKAATVARAQPAAAQAQAARPVIVPESEINPGIALSPGVAAMSPDDVVKAFMGQPVETPAAVETDKGETTATTEEETQTETATEETETETQAEDETSTGAETETETNAEPATQLDGIVKALAKFPELSGITKRVTKIIQGHTEQKERLKQLEQKPATVLAPSEADPLSHAATEADVEAAVTSALSDAKSKLRWLNRHPDGGTWAEGTDQEQSFDARQVDRLIEHYESISDNAAKAGDARKQYLRDYAATVETLDGQPADILNPKTPTRESKLIRAVPEIMKTPDYLQVLADAKAGREQREKKAKGIQIVEIDPKKGKTTAAAPKPNREPNPAASSNTRPTVAAPVSAETALTLAQLREKAASGSQQAQEEIMRRFMAPA